MVSLTYQQARRTGQHGGRHRERRVRKMGGKGRCGGNGNGWDGAESTGMLYSRQASSTILCYLSGFVGDANYLPIHRTPKAPSPSEPPSSSPTVSSTDDSLSSLSSTPLAPTSLVLSSLRNLVPFTRPTRSVSSSSVLRPSSVAVLLPVSV